MQPGYWITLEEFPRYAVDKNGNILHIARDRIMKPSVNNHGHVKISLLNERGRFDRSVARLVAENFCTPPDSKSTAVVQLNGAKIDCRSINLVWRTPSIAWRYLAQLQSTPPMYYLNLPIIDVSTGIAYTNVVSAGLTNGVLFDDIWRSTYTGDPVYPVGSTFVVDKKSIGVQEKHGF